MRKDKAYQLRLLSQAIEKHSETLSNMIDEYKNLVTFVEGLTDLDQSKKSLKKTLINMYKNIKQAMMQTKDMALSFKAFKE